MAMPSLNLKAHKVLRLAWLNILPLQTNQEAETIVEVHLCMNFLPTNPLADPQEIYPCLAVVVVVVVHHLVLMVNTIRLLHLAMMFVSLISVEVVPLRHRIVLK
jgi:hypothetical protein